MLDKSTFKYTLYLATDRNFPGSRDDICLAVEQAILGGVTMVQVREKDAGGRKFYEIAGLIQRVTQYYRVPLIINDRLDIALALQTEGVHLGQSDLPAVAAKKLLLPGQILGISASNLEQAVAAEKYGADYIGVGAVFPTSTKSDAKHLSLEEVKEITDSVNIPVVAIGGINAENAGQLRNTGIDGITVVSAILGRIDVRQAAVELKKAFLG